MKSFLRARTAVCLPLLGLLLVLLAPTSSTAQQAASLHISPRAYVGGQNVTFEGNIGRTGVRRVHLQTHMGRPGDRWTDLEGGFSAQTERDGDFRFSHQAPSMFGIKMRVVSGRVATPAVTFDAKSQDLVLDAVGTPTAGEPFTLRVDTTPDLPRRPDLDGLPVFEGRTLTLQRRVNGDQWETLATTATDGNGNGSFQQTVAQPGTVVYRVRQEDWTKGGSQVGWFPSFPTPVRVVGDSARSAVPAPTSTTSRSTSGTATPLPARAAGGHATASKTFGWSPSLWDFAWEFGESLTSRAYRGTDRRGRWIDTSDGSGRAAKHNGGLMLDSQRDPEGPGDHGTTAVTLRGNPAKYGRWEAKMRLKWAERSARDYHALIELVPERARDYRCGARNITVADVAVSGSTLRIGAKALRGAREWSATKRYDAVQTSAQSFAVEVSKRHISWFLNGRVIGTVRSRAAVSDVPMTLRLSLVGDGQHEMNKTQFISDWQRSFSLERGRKVTSGARLKTGTHAGGC